MSYNILAVIGVIILIDVPAVTEPVSKTSQNFLFKSLDIRLMFFNFLKFLVWQSFQIPLPSHRPRRNIQ